jgi:hypothetical protein
MVRGPLLIKYYFTELPALNECFVENDFEIWAVTADPTLCVIGPRPYSLGQGFVPTLVLQKIIQVSLAIHGGYIPEKSQTVNTKTAIFSQK